MWIRKIACILLTVGLVMGLFSCSDKPTKPQAAAKRVYPTSIGKIVKIYTDDKSTRISLEYESYTARIDLLKGGVVRVLGCWSNTLIVRESYAVVSEFRSVDLEGVKPVIEWNSNRITAKWDDLQLNVAVSNFEVSVSRDGKELIRFSVAGTKNEEKSLVKMKCHGERFFGLGEKTGKLELTGRSFVNYNSDTYKYTETTDPIYCSIPFYHAIGDEIQYSVFFDNPAKAGFSFRNDDYSYSIADLTTDIYLFTGKIENNIAQYTELTGKPYLPPVWGFGFHQSRYSYTNAEQVLSVADTFRKLDLPLDVIYLDIGFMSNNMAFTYDPRRYADPKAMMATLKAMKVRTTAIVDPGIKVEKKYDVYTEGLAAGAYCVLKNKPYTGTVWPGICVFPDFTAPNTAEWWGKQYRKLTDLGIEGFWNDMNEPSVFNGPYGTMANNVIQDNRGNPREHRYLHNIYGLTMIEATHRGLLKIFPDKRVFLLTRAGYAGLQRAAFIWTGDNSSDWTHLRMNMTMALNLGLSGVPYVGSDIGGYTGSPDSELFTRWIQLAVFIPFMRDHTESGTAFQEPYMFKDNLDTIRKYMKLRYKLLPYLYTLAYESTKTGKPIVRPMFFEFGTKTIEVDDQFMFGSAILVKPALKRLSEEAEWTVILPEGGWTDYFTGEKFSGASAKYTATMSDIPVLVRGGSILPTYEFPMQSTMDLTENRDVTLTVYPDAKGKATGRLYEDDGLSMGYQRGEYRLMEFSYAQKGEKASFKAVLKDGKWSPKRQIIVILPKDVTDVSVDDIDLKPVDGKIMLEIE